MRAAVITRSQAGRADGYTGLQRGAVLTRRRIAPLRAMLPADPQGRAQLTGDCARSIGYRAVKFKRSFGGCIG